MGCGSSDGNVHAPLKAGYHGPVTVELRQAVLEKDAALLGSMDPYVKLIQGSDSIQSPVCKGGGKYPIFKNYRFPSFHKKTEDHDYFKIQVWAHNLLQSDVLIGEGAVSLCNIRKGNNQDFDEFVVPIFDHGKVSGQVTIAINFQLDQTGFNIPFVKAPNTVGKLQVNLKEGTLKHDVNLFTKMDPLAVLRFGQESNTSAVNEDGGKNPKWNAKMTFTKELKDDILCVEVWNFSELGSNDLIGVGFISITETLSLEDVLDKKINIYFHGQYAGEIIVDLKFLTDEPQKYFPPQQNQQQPVQPQGNQNLLGLAQIPQQLTNFVSNVANFITGGPQQQNGVMILTAPNGDVYEGEVVNGLRQGNGKLTFASGGYYEGQFFNNFIEGKGKQVLPNETYEGSFTKGKRSGKGLVMWANGQGYQGHFVNNLFDGEGEWIFQNGLRKKGFWINGNRDCWADQENDIIRAGQPLAQGRSIKSQSGQFTMIFHFDGKIYINDEQTKTCTFQIGSFNRTIYSPYWIKLEPHGELTLIDNTGQKYWSNMLLNPGVAPYKMILNDQGKLEIQDQMTGTTRWLSH